MSSNARTEFSHIYVERAAREYPLTARVLGHFAGAAQIPVEDYRHIFNRPRQRFQQQKRGMKLILAVKKDGWIYPGSDNAQDFGAPNFFYTTPLLNCLYNCDYCFLQGMYGSANLVLFVNQDDLMRAAADTAAAPPDPAHPVVLALSYNTDLLALEQWVPLCRGWIEHARQTPNLQVEIRTKSANFRAIADIPPTADVVLAWTLSPEPVARRYEKRAPPLAARLRAARKALDAGWPVRLCFDPVLPVADTEAVYGAFFENVFGELPPEAVRDASTGVFRMAGSYFKTIQKNRTDCDLYYRRYDHADGLVKHPEPEESALMDWVESRLRHYLPPEKIDVWRG